MKVVLYCIVSVQRKAFQQHFAVKSLFFGFDFYLISLEIMYVHFLCHIEAWV